MASPLVSWHIKDDNLKLRKPKGVQDCMTTPLHCNIGILFQDTSHVTLKANYTVRPCAVAETLYKSATIQALNMCS